MQKEVIFEETEIEKIKGNGKTIREDIIPVRIHIEIQKTQKGYLIAGKCKNKIKILPLNIPIEDGNGILWIDNVPYVFRKALSRAYDIFYSISAEEVRCLSKYQNRNISIKINVDGDVNLGNFRTTFRTLWLALNQYLQKTDEELLLGNPFLAQIVFPYIHATPELEIKHVLNLFDKLGQSFIEKLPGLLIQGIWVLQKIQDGRRIDPESLKFYTIKNYENWIEDLLNSFMNFQFPALFEKQKSIASIKYKKRHGHVNYNGKRKLTVIKKTNAPFVEILGKSKNMIENIYYSLIYEQCRFVEGKNKFDIVSLMDEIVFKIDNEEIRRVNGTHFGRICPLHTPEGHNVGVVNYLAEGAVISKAVPEEVVSNLLTIISQSNKNEGEVPVFVDGNLCAVISRDEISDFVEFIKAFRTQEQLRLQKPLHINVGYNDELECVYINTQAGRILRPLATKYYSGESLEDIDNLVIEGKIELLDIDEEDDAYVAISWQKMTPEHTHGEIDTKLLFSKVTNELPYFNHNSSARGIIATSQLKQAFGYNRDWIKRTGKGYELTYPQKPMVKTGDLMDKYLCGQNIVVAILSHPYNMQDAIVFNKASIDRGLFRGHYFRKYEAEKIVTKTESEFRLPDNPKFYGEERYHAIGEDGVAEIESYIEPNDVVIAHQVPARFGKFKMIDRSISVEYKYADCYVHEAYIHPDKRVVITRQHLIPELGDKFASRHGQKGVIGMIVPQEDMPFTGNGIIPDLIINPHSIPSRMTVGQMLEMIAGKVASLRGERANGSAFAGESEESLRKQLKELGFKNNGKEILYDGRTGQIIESEIYTGVMYYMRLTHIPRHKIKVVSEGRKNILTHQEADGLRLGEMERDVLIAYGADDLLRERFDVDIVTIKVCSKCGMINPNPRRGCCGELVSVQVPYSWLIATHEIKSMLVDVRMKTDFCF